MATDRGFIHRLWEKCISNNIGSSGEPLKAALLINYDPSGPSRLLSVMILVSRNHLFLLCPVQLLAFGGPLKATLLINYDPYGPSRLLSVIAEQEGIKAKAAELYPFLDFVKRNNLHTEFFFIGQNQYLVTSIHEHRFCARCVNTPKPAGEGVIVMQTTAFLLVAMYEGSIASASRAMVAVDQFVLQLSRRNL